MTERAHLWRPIEIEILFLPILATCLSSLPSFLFSVNRNNILSLTRQLWKLHKGKALSPMPISTAPYPPMEECQLPGWVGLVLLCMSFSPLAPSTDGQEMLWTEFPHNPVREARTGGPTTNGKTGPEGKMSCSKITEAIAKEPVPELKYIELFQLNGISLAPKEHIEHSSTCILWDHVNG